MIKELTIKNFKPSKVERYGKLLCSMSTDTERYCIYEYKEKYFEIEKELGEVTSISVKKELSEVMKVRINSIANDV